MGINGHVLLTVEKVGSLPKSLHTFASACLDMPIESVRFGGHDEGHFIVVVASRCSAPDLFCGFAMLANHRPIVARRESSRSIGCNRLSAGLFGRLRESV